MTDPITAARALLDKVPPLFIDLDGDLCREGGGYNLVGCAATDDEPPFGPLNPVIWSSIPALRDMVATLADALEAERAKVAAAYDAAEGLCKRRYQYYEQMVANAERSGPSHPEYICDSTYHHWSGQSSAFYEIATDIRKLTPADAQAALDKLLAKARAEGWRAGRDAAACEAVRYDCSEGSDDFTIGIQTGYRDAKWQIVEGIRALREPKETSHD